MTQKDAFLRGEGDAYFRRNVKKVAEMPDGIIPALQDIGLKPKRILEIGCSDGVRLEALRGAFGAKCVGIDPTAKGIAVGRKTYPKLSLKVGTADRLPFKAEAFDLVIFGFCLYLCDPADHFRIVAEADRVLRDGGALVIRDFNAPAPYRREYAYKRKIFSHKMDWSRLFTAHPSYRMLSRRYSEAGGGRTFAIDECVTVDVLRKDLGGAFQLRS